MLASWNLSYKDVAERLNTCKTTSKPAKSPTQEPTKPKEDFDNKRVRAGIEILQRHPLLAGLSLPQIRTLYDSFDRQRVSEGAILIEANEPNNYLFVLIKGRASVRTASGVELTVLGAGSWFGEMAMVDDAVASAQVRAASPWLYSPSNTMTSSTYSIRIRIWRFNSRHFAAEMAHVGEPPTHRRIKEPDPLPPRLRAAN